MARSGLFEMSLIHLFKKMKHQNLETIDPNPANIPVLKILLKIMAQGSMIQGSSIKYLGLERERGGPAKSVLARMGGGGEIHL